jgi:hypothetical protein
MNVSGPEAAALPGRQRLCRGKRGADYRSYGAFLYRTGGHEQCPAVELQQHPLPMRESQRDRQRVFTRRPPEGITLVRVFGGRPPSCVANTRASDHRRHHAVDHVDSHCVVDTSVHKLPQPHRDLDRQILHAMILADEQTARQTVSGAVQGVDSLKVRWGGAKSSSLANRLGASDSKVSYWSRGVRPPSSREAVHVARTFGRSPLEGLIAAGHLDAGDLSDHVSITYPTLADFTDVELAKEVLRRAST